MFDLNAIPLHRRNLEVTGQEELKVKKTAKGYTITLNVTVWYIPPNAQIFCFRQFSTFNAVAQSVYEKPR
uniref:COX2_CUA domain-containing protein n=1 Tax=Angiostrongylus cantonensis TaxID=6313 RepID=A0A0K0D478_ANGCA